MDINPIPPNYENSTWAEDWTANLDTTAYINQLVASGVNTVNVFCGQLDIVNGTPVVDGFSEDTPNRPPGTGAFPNINALRDFVQKCQAGGIKVKLSVGGAAGTHFGQSWQLLNSNPGSVNNINQFAQALATLCHYTGASGIDFDDELDDPTISMNVGLLAAALNNLNPNLQISACVFAGIGSGGPWHSADVNFFKYAVNAEGKSVIDRVYVMSYYDGESLSTNEGFMEQWAQWLGTNYGIQPAQISAGMDPNDPTTSPTNGSLAAWIGFAASHGFSTAIWDQQGIDDYLKGNGSESWGTIVEQIYEQEFPTDENGDFLINPNNNP